MHIDDVTPAIFCKNEEYWIAYVIRDLLKVFNTLIVLDTGSQDDTKAIIVETAKHLKCFHKLVLIEEDFGRDADLIGDSPNRLRKLVKTEWMLLLGGDEIWRVQQLIYLLGQHMPQGRSVGMVRGRNVASVDNQIVEIQSFSADRLFDRTTRWNKTDYPFEGHGLHSKVDAGEVHYFDGENTWYWHVRDLRRSRMDDKTFMRIEKSDFFSQNVRGVLDYQWFGDIMPTAYLNPYINEAEYVQSP